MVDMAAQQSTPVFRLTGLCIFKADATAQRHLLSHPFTCSMCRAIGRCPQVGQKKQGMHLHAVWHRQKLVSGDLHVATFRLALAGG